MLFRAPHRVVLVPHLPPVIAVPVVPEQSGSTAFPAALEDGNVAPAEEIGL